MPKISTAKPDPASASGSSSSTPSQHPNVLKRNQACHQCRRRKLVCDANRPCSTCVRSHAHAVTHAPAGAVVPDHPECTYDEIPGIIGALDPPKNRYEKLENRINELEALLKDQSVSADMDSPNLDFSDLASTLPLNSASATGLSSPISQFQPSLATYQMPINFTTVDSSPSDPSPSALASNISSSPTIQIDSGASMPSTDQFSYDVFWPSWPPDLPLPNMLRHLVEVFFAFHPHAGRLFHGPTFMASLSLPPSHPKFPPTSVLHAICAVGSLYTVAVSPTPEIVKDMAPGMFNDLDYGAAFMSASSASPSADEIFGNRYKTKHHIDSFAEQQIKLARRAAEEAIWAGKDLFENTQALLIIVWWYWCNAKWVEVFMTVAQVVRSGMPLGINVSSPFHPISESLRAPSLIPPPEDLVEDETRRNTFWLAYAMDRMASCSNGWPMSLDDQDVSQLVPAKGANFDLGQNIWPISERQHAHTKDLLLIHPEDQVDSFGLYIKGSILLSKVKAYNLRFRSKRFSGDPAFAYASSYSEIWERDAEDGTMDPRRTPAFVEVDHIATMFRQTFPLHLRNPVPDGVVDSHLYTACLIPHLAIILLHDPHAHVDSAGCVSAFKILEAARGILDLVYAVRSTSYDISLLDNFCAFAWFMAGRVLVRFWHAAQEAKSDEQIITLRAEVEYIASAIAKFGERIPLANRYYRMINDLAMKTCGEKILVTG
ncbi:hypothetical protein FA95DRAFT_1511617 [Auriscalpium vulgare]|uniref:Uncharacterized protein n=1 Tax=Auriscalpium vulgare TaxID=40419 RepID=A0ACB8S6G3_9AGAM|nr:hypothetical protein FA95DRAFT_1511617 [Auriscalpium vulgare]